jgi:very-short-patch-repair endonuclease
MPPGAPNPPADGTKTGDIDTFSSRRATGLGLDHLISEVAERQHGVVGLDEFRAVKLSAAAVRKRARSGRLHQVHQGVYAIGHRHLTTEGRWMAAVLACGPGAVLSHRSAAALVGLRPDRRTSIDVIAPNRRGRSPKGVDAHRDGSLMPADRTALYGIPCTTVERTLLDLAGTLPVWELRKALAEAEVLRVLDLAALRGLIRRSRGRRGVARLRLLLDELDPATKRTRSELERLFLRMCTRAELPRPEVNARLDVGDGYLEADFLWRNAGLIVEADSRRFHDTNSAFDHDRRREQRLQLAGWRVSRCTWLQVESEPHRLAATIRALLAQSNPRRRAHNGRYSDGVVPSAGG